MYFHSLGREFTSDCTPSGVITLKNVSVSRVHRAAAVVLAFSRDTALRQRTGGRIDMTAASIYSS